MGGGGGGVIAQAQASINLTREEKVEGHIRTCTQSGIDTGGEGDRDITPPQQMSTSALFVVCASHFPSLAKKKILYGSLTMCTIH